MLGFVAAVKGGKAMAPGVSLSMLVWLYFLVLFRGFVLGFWAAGGKDMAPW